MNLPAVFLRNTMACHMGGDRCTGLGLIAGAIKRLMQARQGRGALVAIFCALAKIYYSCVCFLRFWPSFCFLLFNPTTPDNNKITCTLPLKRLVAGVRERGEDFDFWLLNFTTTHRITAVCRLTGIFFFSCDFNKETIQWSLLLPPFEDLAEMRHCIVLKQIHRSHCYSLIWVVLFYKVLRFFQHFSHLPGGHFCTHINSIC